MPERNKDHIGVGAYIVLFLLLPLVYTLPTKVDSQIIVAVQGKI